MNPSLGPLAVVYALNTRLFYNCLVDVPESAATTRPNQHTNNLAFVAAHLVDSRAWMAGYVGLEEPKPFGGALEYGKGIDDLAQLPSLAETRDAWEAVSERLERRLVWLTAEDLAAPSKQRFPRVPQTVLGGLAFLMQHESYHIGQLAFLRKYCGLPAMSYRVDG
jgi:uncharacterized damage-inducible protein DinB